jgi:hypothetical protein
MFIQNILLILLSLLFISCGTQNDSQKNENFAQTYQIHNEITTTLFWVGEEANSSTNGDISNISSAWDENWTISYGGVDNNNNFTPKENSFYFALPFNDFDTNGKRKENLKDYIPWAKEYDLNSTASICKNRWIKISKGSLIAYAQWEDVGPFGEDDVKYVFGDASVSNPINEYAGLDVSPSVNKYLSLNGMEKTSWQFVDFTDVSDGPWLKIVTTSNIDQNWYKPNTYTSWQWQLTGEINTQYDVDLYDIDLFETSNEEIQAIKNSGKKVICYFSAGSYEEGREDSDSFTSELKGKKMDGWDELWLDIRDETLRPIMKGRLDLAKEKGCDGVEADNVDAYLNDSGFNLTSENQLEYNKFLADEAHKRGLAIGLKNDLAQIGELVKYFDFAVNEQCQIFEECDLLIPFIKVNKPVFHVEYNQKYIDNTNGSRDFLCQESKKNKFETLILPLNLNDSFRYSCE